MTEKKSFILYHDLCEIFAELTDEQAGQLIKEIALYAKAITHNNPQKPIGLSGLLNAIASPFKNHIDRDFAVWLEKRETNAENGKKGGRPPKKKNPNNPVKGVTATVTVTDTVSVINTKQKNIPQVLAPDWQAYAKNNNLNPQQANLEFEKFTNHYLAKKEVYDDYLPLWRNWLLNYRPPKDTPFKPQPKHGMSRKELNELRLKQAGLV